MRLYKLWIMFVCQNDQNGNIDVGFSINLKQQIKAHNDAKVPANAGFLPAKLKSYASVETKEKAMTLEKYFKPSFGKAAPLKRFLYDSGAQNHKHNLKFY